MPDSLKHRGRHPQDGASFHCDQIPRMESAARDFSWLKTRGYADPSSLKLVGDRYQLNARQRTAVARCTCSETELLSRKSRQIDNSQLFGKKLFIDGFNLLTSIEAALGNGILLIGMDGCLRDMSSMHGNYRVLADTDEAIHIINRFLTQTSPDGIHWLLDKPVSNSGRLKAKMLDLTDWEVQLVQDPDPVLKAIPQSDDNIIVTADSGILDDCGFWSNFARAIVAEMPKREDRIILDFSN